MADGFVTIGSYNDTASAHLAEQTLAAAGIKTTLVHEQLIGTTMEFVAYGPIELRVRRKDERRARQILEGKSSRPRVRS